MGGSKSYSIKVMRGDGRKGSGGGGGGGGGASSSTQTFLKKVSSGVTNEIIAQALNLVLTYDPTINAILMATEMVKTAYEMAVAAFKEYERTQDPDAALQAAGKVILQKGIEKGKEELVKLAVSQSWSAIKENNNIKSNDVVDTIVTDAVTNVVEEYIP